MEFFVYFKLQRAKLCLYFINHWNHGDQGFFLFEVDLKCFGELFLIHSNTYVMPMLWVEPVLDRHLVLSDYVGWCWDRVCVTPPIRILCQWPLGVTIWPQEVNIWSQVVTIWPQEVTKRIHPSGLSTSFAYNINITIDKSTFVPGVSHLIIVIHA